MHKKVIAAMSVLTVAVVLLCVVFSSNSGNVGASDGSASATKLGATLSVAQPGENGNSKTASEVINNGRKAKELRGMWITYFELGQMFDSAEGFKHEFDAAVEKCLEYGVNAVFVHVRSHADAYYPSKLFPWSKYVSGMKGTQGKAPDFDPLEYMIDATHTRGVEFHAWINPYRVSHDSTQLNLLADSNRAKQWLEDSETDNDTWVVECNSGLYFNPAVTQVQSLVLGGIRELVENYNIDGIHFDDYFYPTTDESFDEKEYAEYRSKVWGTPLSLADWRRANVNSLLSRVYSTVKRSAPDCVFGVSPMASIDNNYSTVFADIRAWLDGGYVDYVMPQIYFGFEYPKASSTFEALLAEWSELFKGRQQSLYVGLGAYRIGADDETNVEWSQHDDMLSRQIKRVRADKECSGFVFYSYSAFFADSEHHAAERLNVKNTM